MPVNSFDNYPMTWKPDRDVLTHPYYLSLAEQLEEEIKSGRLSPGTLLPPQRELADFLDVNFTTITRTYNTCKQKGLIYGITGKGTFVAPHAAEKIRIYVSDLDNGCIELGAVNGFSEYSELVEKATQSVVAKGYLRNLYDYHHPLGHPHQLAAGLRWMEQMGVHSDSEHTAIFAGAQNALTIALISLFSPGDKIATDKYTYSNMIELAKLLNIVLIPIEGDTHGMIASELQKQCRRQKINGVYLMPSCSNPTSICIPIDRRKELASVIKEQDLILIEDDVSAWLSTAYKIPTTSMFDIIPDQSLYICATTKSLCPGLRIAFMAFSEKFKEKILNGFYNINIKTSSLDAEIITELILNGDAYRIAENKRDLAKKACLLFDEYFPNCRHDKDFVTYYCWLPIDTDKPFYEVEDDLAKLGVRIYHSNRFAVANDDKQSYLRVSLSSAGSMPKLKKALGILRDYLNS
ncbi:MAG: PLP-dependent aminotransferase family protein [Clostridioides sp.]|nr:PLP-dependent aminotransferase family protein [Clostridioides sp.]